MCYIFQNLSIKDYYDELARDTTICYEIIINHLEIQNDVKLQIWCLHSHGDHLVQPKLTALCHHGLAQPLLKKDQ